MCVGELVTDDDENDDIDNRQFMIAYNLWHSANEPKSDTCPWSDDLSDELLYVVAVM